MSRKKDVKDIYGLDGCKNIDEFIDRQIKDLKSTDESFANLFDVMFSVKSNIMFEFSDGNKINSLTYGEVAEKIKEVASNLKRELTNLVHNSIVGLYMDNGIEWIYIFWAILMCGFRPLLLNKRVDKVQLANLMKQHSVEAVVCDAAISNVKNIDYRDLLDKAQPIEDMNWADEIILMTSGTTLNFKLCVYSGKNICNQIYNTKYITKNNKLIKTHYDGKIRILTFLPFYHIFGLVACYMWFALFSRTFVLLKDMSGETILNTIKKHKVTHLFAVPILWEKIEKSARKKIADRGAKLESKFTKAIKFSNKLQNFWPWLGRVFAKKAFKELRANAFGESIQFLITGGGSISTSVLELLNGVGYRLANGYGMTEIGIASVELSNKTKWLNSGSIGKPFSSVEFKVENQQLLVKGDSLASKIISGDKVLEINNTWFETGDIVRKKKSHYYIIGRADDLIVGADGENLCPDEIENKLKFEDAEIVVLSLKKETAKTILIMSISKYYSQSKVLAIKQKLFENLSKNNIGKSIDEIYFTFDPLLFENEIKISRKNIINRIEEKSLILRDIKEIDNCSELSICSDLQKEILQIFEDILNKQLSEKDYDLNFFYELDGDSLLYFSMVEQIKTKYGVSLPLDNESMISVNGVASFIQDKIN